MPRQSNQTHVRSPKQERGFALLLVFAMAASVAILIYLEIPRVAFERQRDKEALLIDRGEQYMRGIELYARKMNKLPQTLDELEHAQTIRFLRRRYKDPMTGKDEWRLVHLNANGQYVDSKIHKATGSLDKKDSGPSVLASKIQGIGQSVSIIAPVGQGNSAALQKRASDRIIPGSPGGLPGGSGQNQPADANLDPNLEPNQDPNLDPNLDSSVNPNQPQNNAAAGQPPVPPPTGSFSPRFPNAGLAGGAQQPGSAQNAGGAGDLAGAPTFGSVLPPAQPNTSGAFPGQDASKQPPAIQAIQAIIGSQSSSNSGAGNQAGRSQAGTGQAGGAPSGLGAGLVGIATTVEMEGIRRYKDHSNYSEWEFIFDPKDSKGQGQGSSNQKGTAGNASNPGNSASAPFGGMAPGVPAPPTAGPNN